MDKAVLSDKETIVNIIVESFQDNPSVLLVIKNDNNKNKRIKALAAYAFDTAIIRNGVYISSDRQGAAICYRYNYRNESLIDYWNQLKLVVKVIGISRIFNILKRDSFVKSKRPKSGNYLYFWFFGVTDNGKGKTAAIELKNVVFHEAKENNLPIYLETSVEKNKRVYEYYGFEVYYTWSRKEVEDLWFMRKFSEPLSNK